MTNFELSKDAQRDLRDVARYAKDKWGIEQLSDYRDGLILTFNAIAQKSIVARQFSKNYPQLRVTKYRFHYIFYIAEGGVNPVIIGVIHERRDVVNYSQCDWVRHARVANEPARHQRKLRRFGR